VIVVSCSPPFSQPAPCSSRASPPPCNSFACWHPLQNDARAPAAGSLALGLAPAVLLTRPRSFAHLTMRCRSYVRASPRQSAPSAAVARHRLSSELGMSCSDAMQRHWQLSTTCAPGWWWQGVRVGQSACPAWRRAASTRLLGGGRANGGINPYGVWGALPLHTQLTGERRHPQVCTPACVRTVPMRTHAPCCRCVHVLAQRPLRIHTHTTHHLQQPRSQHGSLLHERGLRPERPRTCVLLRGSSPLLLLLLPALHHPQPHHPGLQGGAARKGGHPRRAQRQQAVLNRGWQRPAPRHGPQEEAGAQGSQGQDGCGDGRPGQGPRPRSSHHHPILNLAWCWRPLLTPPPSTPPPRHCCCCAGVKGDCLRVCGAEE